MIGVSFCVLAVVASVYSAIMSKRAHDAVVRLESRKVVLGTPEELLAAMPPRSSMNIRKRLAEAEAKCQA